jgi:hypothetical protein
MLSTPWRCLIAAGSVATVQSPLFVIEAQTDRVVMPLHDGLPPVWKQTPPLCNNSPVGCPKGILQYMSEWRGQMEALLASVHPLKEQTFGYFNPACLLHGDFTHAYPLINGASYIQAFDAWAFHNKTVLLQDRCGTPMCNPTCKLIPN